METEIKAISSKAEEKINRLLRFQQLPKYIQKKILKAIMNYEDSIKSMTDVKEWATKKYKWDEDKENEWSYCYPSSEWISMSELGIFGKIEEINEGNLSIKQTKYLYEQ